MSEQYIEANWYFCGVYQGKRRIHQDSLLGKLLQGDMSGALKESQAMQEGIQDLSKSRQNEEETKQ